MLVNVQMLNNARRCSNAQQCSSMLIKNIHLLTCSMYSSSVYVHACHKFIFPCILYNIGSIKAIIIIVTYPDLNECNVKPPNIILGPTTASYKDRLVSLKILPLMQWFELHDILFLVKCIKNPPDNFSLSDYFTFTTSNFKIKHSFSKFSASRHFYFNRIPRLWNSLSPIDTTKSTQTIK